MMKITSSQPLKIGAGTTTVSALLIRPDQARCCFVFAHGAGAGMTHAFLERAATGLAVRGIASLRYQFPYPGLPLIAGGKSFGGRMTSQAQAKAPLAGVVGLAFFGFPLHAAGKPSADRADHLADVQIPMLFLQGGNDKLAELSLLTPVVERLGVRARLHLVEGADHSFHVPARSGRTDGEVMEEIFDAFAAWSQQIVGRT
jgi:uncharacterized protein